MGAQTNATVSAVSGSVTKTASVTLLPAVEPLPALSALGTGDGNLRGGGAHRAYVALTGKAGSGGAAVEMHSDNPDVIAPPASALVPEGSSSLQFWLFAQGVDSTVTVTISASFGGVTKSSAVTVVPAALGSAAFDHDSVLAGNPVNLVVRLEGVAGPSGVSVSLSTDDPSTVQVPASLSFAQGERSKTVQVTTNSVTENKVVVITASYNGVTKSVSLYLRAK